jgi:PTH1 family peptidyl-tRNA hydrolase
VFCIIGLGNPGIKYKKTRHNVGFMVIDELAKKWNIKLDKGKGPYKFKKTEVDRKDVLLVRPTTFVNKSGIAVETVCNKYQIHLSNLLILCDDFNLPLGKLRLRKKGSNGGHNGLASIIQSLETQLFPRLRFGIGLPKQIDTVDYVLSPFHSSEIETVEVMIEKGVQAVTDFISQGVHWTMDNYNG